MKAAAALLDEIIRDFPRRDELRLIGGLAVLAHLGTTSRVSVDVDLVTMTTETRTSLIAHLETKSFRVGETGAWWRAAREREIVDIATNPVVQPRTFETVTLHAAAPVAIAGVAAVNVDDLVMLKLLAGRDQDNVDVMLLATHAKPSAATIAAYVEADDLSRSVASRVLELRYLLEHGHLDQTCVELLGRAPLAAERRAISAFLDDLAKAGL